MAENKRKKIRIEESRICQPNSLSENDKKIIVENIGEHLQALGRELQLTETQLSQLKQENENLHEKAYKVIGWWIEKNGQDATKDLIIAALRKIGRRDISDQLSQFSLTEIYKIPDLSTLQQRLKNIYSRISLPQPPGVSKDLPIDKVFIEQELKRFTNDASCPDDARNTNVSGQSHSASKHQCVKILDLFKIANGQLATRILIEGDPGFGKTTLATKLATDWANGKDYIASQFQLVLLIPLREVREQSMEDVIMRITKYDKSSLDTLLAENKVLLILDGYDEMSSQGRDRIRPILCKEQLESTCVLVTSRRGLFTVRNSIQHSTSLLACLEQSTELLFWDCRVLMKGLSVQQRKALLQQYFVIDSDVLEKQIHKLFDKATRDMFQCPLFVFWLGFMLENMNIYDIRSRTSFFKSLVNLIFHKTLVREEQMQETDQLDIFSKDAKSSNLRNELIEFGSIALQRLFTGDVLFTETDLQSLSSMKSCILLKSDILMKYKSITRYQEETHYQPMHRTFLEFLAAFSVASSVVNGECKMIVQLMKQGVVPSLNSLFYPFLAGLLGQNASWLFQCLSPWESLFNVLLPDMKNILIELTHVNDNIIQSLLNFVPSWYGINKYDAVMMNDYYSSDCHKKLIEAAVKNNVISGMYWDPNILHSLPSVPFELQRLTLKLKNSCIPAVNSVMSPVHCRELILYINQMTNLSSFGYFLSHSLLKADHFHLDIFDEHSFGMTSILNAIKEWKTKGILDSFERIRFVSCALEHTHLSMLTELVKTDVITKGIHINTLRVTFDEALQLSALWEAVQNSKSIDEFSVNNYFGTQKIDIAINNSVSKMFKMLKFEGWVNLKPIQQTPSCISIQELSLLTHKYDVANFLNFINSVQNLVHLECESKVLFEALSTHSSLLTSLRELTLHKVYDSISISSEVSLTNLMPLLESLTVDLDYAGSYKTYDPVENFLIPALKSNKLKSIELLNRGTKIVLRSLASAFSKSLTNQKIILPNLLISNLYGIHLRIKDCHSLKNLLMHKQLTQLALVKLNPDIKSVLASVFTEEEFKFENEVEGIKHEHSMRSQQQFMYQYKVNDRLVIKLK